MHEFSCGWSSAILLSSPEHICTFQQPFCSLLMFYDLVCSARFQFSLLRRPTINIQSYWRNCTPSTNKKKKTNRFIPVGSDCIAKFLSVVKSTELFGTVSLLYATVVPVGKCDSILQILFLMSGITIWSGRERLRRQPNVERDDYGISNIFSASTFGDLEM